MKTGILLNAVVMMLSPVSASAQQDIAPAQRWTVTDERVPLTGARSLAASIESTNELTNIIGSPERATLVIRCNAGSLAVYVGWVEVVNYDSHNFAGQPKTMALWRFDNEKIDGNFWDVDTTGTAAGEFKQKNALKLLSRLSSARHLVVRLSGRRTQDAEFELAGIVEVASNAAAACGATLKR